MNEENNLIQKNVHNKSQNKHAKDMPMFWWNFCKYVRFPLGILSYLGNMTYYSELPTNITTNIFFLIDIVIAIFLCATYYHFLKLTKIGYKFLNTWLITELLLNSFNATVAKSGTFVTIDFIIYVIILGLIWTLPNFIYFRKRKNLFDNNVEERSIQDNNHIETIIQPKYSLTKEAAEVQNKALSTLGIGWKISTIVLSILAMIMIILCINSTNNIELLDEEILNLESTILTLKSENKTLKEKNENLQDANEKAQFLDKYIVIRSADTKVYHKYGCKYCDTSSFYIYDINEATANGYVPCDNCMSSSSKSSWEEYKKQKENN